MRKENAVRNATIFRAKLRLGVKAELSGQSVDCGVCFEGGEIGLGLRGFSFVKEKSEVTYGRSTY